MVQWVQKINYTPCPTITHQVKLPLGDRDKMVSFSDIKQVAEKIKKPSILLLPDTPHPIEQVSFGKLAEEISLFFEGQEQFRCT